MCSLTIECVLLGVRGTGSVSHSPCTYRIRSLTAECVLPGVRGTGSVSLSPRTQEIKTPQRASAIALLSLQVLHVPTCA